MPVTYSVHSNTVREFERDVVLREFWSPAIPGGDVVATNPVDVTVDYRRTMIPFEIYSGHSACLYMAPANVVYYLLPDGTEQHGVLYPTYTVPPGSGNQIIRAICEDGKDVSDVTNFHYLGDRSAGRTSYGRVSTSDITYMRPASQIYLFGSYFDIYGDVKNIASVVSAVAYTMNIYSTYGMNGLYGDVNTWEPLKCGQINMYYNKSLTGSLKFIDDAPTAILRFSSCYCFSPEEVSRTIVNWDNCNASSFARTGAFDTIKRSQLTAAGEAAVVSLIAKGTTFSFLAE